MSGPELNKIAASILVAGLIAMIAGKMADILYHPVLHPAKPGYTVAVAEDQSASGGQPAAPAPFEIKIGQLMATASVESGAQLFHRCEMCHTGNKGGPNKLGPNLWNVLGGPRDHLKDYNFSPALEDHPGTWTYQALAMWLHSPQQFIPGTKMTFPGFSNPKDIADVIAYLRTLSDTPQPLPPVEQ